MNITKPQKWGIIAAVLALVLDQGSKNALLYGAGLLHMRPGENVPLLPFFDLVMVWNRGVSYGLFQAGGLLGTIVLTVFSLGAVVALSVWLSRAERPILGIGLGLVVGGALGNVIDRIIYGAVADFFHFYAFGHDWYVFNVADAAICIGVFALLADAFFNRAEPNESSKGSR